MKTFAKEAGGMAFLFLAMPTKLWNLTGRESGRRFLYLQQMVDMGAWKRSS